MSLFWKIVDTLEPDPAQTQIVVGVQRGAAREKRLAHLGALLAEEIAACLQPDEEAEAVLVVASASRGCQEMVMRLSEMGLQQLHAIHPKKSGHKEPAGQAETTSSEGN